MMGQTIYQFNRNQQILAKERYDKALSNFKNDGREFIAASIAYHAAKGLETRKPRRRSR